MLDIVLVSTWESHCGIAMYTADLAAALRALGHRVTVLAEGAPGQGFQDKQAIACWRRGHAYTSQSGLGRVYNLIASSKVKPNVVHFQHEFAFWNDNDFERVVDELQELNIAVTVTLHTVTAPPRRSGLLRRLPYLIERPIIHTHEAAAALQAYGHTTPAVISHGVAIREAPRQPPDGALREKLNLNPSLVYGLVPGFMSSSKGHQEILEGLAASGGVNLILAGECRDDSYRMKLEGWIDEFGVRDRVDLRYGWQASDDLWHIADLVVLGAGKTTPYSASGQLAQAMGWGLPVVAKNVPIYRDGPALLYDTAEECGMLLDYLAFPQNRLRVANDRSKHLAATRQWRDVAASHVSLYREIIEKC